MDLNEFKASIPIIPYIRKHYPNIKLERESNDVAFSKCIFHEENTASLCFFNKNNRYKCFGCGEGGSLIDFVMKVENIDFREAVRMIANNAGVNYALEPLNPEHEAYKDEMGKNAMRYVECLKNSPEALNYLMNIRHLSSDTIEKFRLGYVPKDEYKIRSDIGGIAGRISFPITEHKVNAKCLGMGYRTLEDNVPKYLNDANKDGVFIKGNCLYGFTWAREMAGKKNYVILTEGYFDVLSMYDSGIENVVAGMGTALTLNQAQEILKLSKNVLIMYDMDNAGRKATLKAIETFLMLKTIPYVVEFDYHDLDAFANGYKHDGKAIEQNILYNRKPAIDYLCDKLTEQYKRMVSIERNRALLNANKYSDLLEDSNLKQMFNSLLYKNLDI